MLFFLLKYLHLIGAAVLLGTGAGIAFFMLMAHRTRNIAVIAAVARIVVIADSCSPRRPSSLSRSPALPLLLRAAIP